MKKLILTLIMTLAVGWLLAQNVSPGQVVRIADATTTFGKNIPVGTLVYNVGADALYQCKAATISTLTLTTGAANFTLLATGGAQNLSWDDANHQVDIDGGGSSATIPLADAAGQEGLSSYTAADFDVTAGGVVSIDYTNGQAASTSTKGFLTSTDWNTFNNKLGAGDVDLSNGTVTATTYEIANTGGDNVTLVEATTSTAGLLGADKWDEIVANTAARHAAVTFQAATTATGLALSGQEIQFTAAMTDNKMVTIDDAAGIANGEYLRSTGTGVEARTVSEMQSDLGIVTGAEANWDSKTETFSESTTAVGGDSHSLAETAITSQDVVVAINGAVLNPTAYTLTTTTITVDIQVYQYDEVTITYWY